MQASIKQKAPKWKLPDGWVIVENPTEDQLNKYGLYESADQENNPSALAPKNQGGVRDARLCYATNATLYRFGTNTKGRWWSAKCVKMYSELKQTVWKNYAIFSGWNDLNNYGKMVYTGYAVIGETAALEGDKIKQSLGNANNIYYEAFTLQVFVCLDKDGESNFPENKGTYEKINLPEKFTNQKHK
jgi:hypothetical protein